MEKLFYLKETWLYLFRGLFKLYYDCKVSLNCNVLLGLISLSVAYSWERKNFESFERRRAGIERKNTYARVTRPRPRPVVVPKVTSVRTQAKLPSWRFWRNNHIYGSASQLPNFSVLILVTWYVLNFFNCDIKDYFCT